MLSEKAVFCRIDDSNPQNCSEAYYLVVQTYARLQILNENQHNTLEMEKTRDQENGYQEAHRPDGPASYSRKWQGMSVLQKNGHWGGHH